MSGAMFSPIQPLTAGLADKLFESKKVCPLRIKAAMYLHYDSPAYAKMPQSLLQCTLYALVYKLCKHFNIQVQSVRLIPAPIKGASLYEYEYSIDNKKTFFAYLLSTGDAATPIGLLAQSIQENHEPKGCSNCNFGANLDDDVICSFCRSGETRKILDKHLGDKVFSVTGWATLSETFGTEYTEILTDLSLFHIKIINDEQFRTSCGEIVATAHENESYGTYMEKDFEDLLFLNNGYEAYEEVEGDEADDDEDQDDASEWSNDEDM